MDEVHQAAPPEREDAAAHREVRRRHGGGDDDFLEQPAKGPRPDEHDSDATLSCMVSENQ